MIDGRRGREIKGKDEGGGYEGKDDEITRGWENIKGKKGNWEKRWGEADSLGVFDIDTDASSKR